MKVYTKTGDLGETTSCNGGRVLKNHVVVEANGAVDECNACVGMVLAFIQKEPALNPQIKQLEIIQHLLFDLGTELYATGGEKLNKASQLKIPTQVTLSLEKWVDEMEQTLIPLSYFILPSGPPVIAAIHHARSVCRRAERRLVAVHLKYKLREETLAFINRLSDYLFVLSRFVSNTLNITETRWEANKMGSESN